MPLGTSTSVGENASLYNFTSTFLSNSSYSHTTKSRTPGLQGGLKSPLSSMSWFDIRVVYVRVSSCPLDDESSPDALQFYCPPRSISSELEINGARISPSEEVSLTLRRDRIDCDSAEATYVSTDNVRCNSTVEFEVVHSDEQILSGSLVRMDSSNNTTPECTSTSNEIMDEIQGSASTGTQTQSLKLGWNLECSCTVGPNGCVFMMTKPSHDISSTMLHPTIEVCIVGRYNGLPVILTQTIPLVMRRRIIRRGGLDVIPELDEKDYPSTNNSETGSEMNDAQEAAVIRHQQNHHQAEDDPIRELHEKADALFGGFYGNAAAYSEGEDGEMSWFNAGVRVGVGLGLGMCLGLGIGVGLMIRTYQVTTRSFRRGLF